MSASNGAVILPAGPAGLMLPGVVRTTPLDYLAVPDGLWAYWPFDADTIDANNVQDLSPNAFNFPRITGSATGGTRTTGQIDGGVLLNGTTDVFVAPSGATVAGSSQVTIATWVNLAVIPASVDGTIWAEQTSSGGGLARLGLFVTASTGTVYLRYRDAPNDPAGSGVNITGATGLVAGRWYYIVATYDSVAGVGRVFVNAKLDGSGSLTNPLGSSSTAAISIGALYVPAGSNNFLNATIDDVRIYKGRALSGADTMLLYALGVQGRRDAGPRLPAYADLPALFVAATGAAAGSATGTASASGVGAAKVAAAGAATGTASVTAVGASTFAASGSVTATASAAGVGVAIGAGVGSATGTAAVSAVGASTFAAAGSATGTAAVTAVGASIFAAVGSATGSAAVSGASPSATTMVGAASGVAAANAVGASIFAAVGIVNASAVSLGVGPVTSKNRFFMLF